MSHISAVVFYNGVHLYVESAQPLVSATRGSSVILPCHYRYEPELSAPRRTRIKWSWLPAGNRLLAEADAAHALPSVIRETEVMVAMGNRHRSYGGFRGRVRLRRSTPGDMSLMIRELQLNDTGRYRCEVIDGVEDESVTVDLEMRGARVCACARVRVCACVTGVVAGSLGALLGSQTQEVRAVVWQQEGCWFDPRAPPPS